MDICNHDLGAALAAFADRFRRLQVEAAVLDLTDCFRSPETGRHVAPRSYGPLPQSRVMGYVARGAALVAKYARDGDGRVLRDAEGHPVIGPFTMVHRVMACLCVPDMRNTSLHEIADALADTHRLQGYRRWHLRRLTEAAAGAVPGFRPEADSLFLFAGPAGCLGPRIALNAAWLEGILRHGADAPDRMTAGEAALMPQVFPPALLAGDRRTILRHSYMWERPLWQPQSATFLARKAAAWRATVGARVPAHSAAPSMLS